MRALIVDDSILIRAYLRGLLDGMDVVCVEAAHGREALAVLRGAMSGDAEGFDLMLLDMHVPLLDGLECVRMVRALGLHPQMKVMMVTTEFEDGFFREARECGADAFMLKPFTPEDLREKILMLTGCVA